MDSCDLCHTNYWLIKVEEFEMGLGEGFNQNKQVLVLEVNNLHSDLIKVS